MAKTKTAPAPKSSSTLKTTIQELNKRYGDGAIIQGRGAVVAVESFPTGIASLDVALGVRGLPLGRIIEIYGGESSGKTTTCLQIIAACQSHQFRNRKGVAALIDAEHAFDPAWAQRIGVDMDTLMVSQPDSGEQALEIVEALIKSGELDLIVVDSVAALVPQEELDGVLGDSTIGAQARLMSKSMRRIKGEASRSKTTVIFINQVREKIGVRFGNPETTPGGRALKFYASIRMQVNKGSPVKKNDTVVAFRPTIKIVKNKVAAPFTSATFDICVGTTERPIYGIDKGASLIDLGEAYKIIELRGSSYRYGDTVLGNGLANASKHLQENPELAEQLRQEIYDKALSKPVAQPVMAESIDDIIDEIDEEQEDG